MKFIVYEFFLIGIILIYISRTLKLIAIFETHNNPEIVEKI